MKYRPVRKKSPSSWRRGTGGTASNSQTVPSPRYRVTPGVYAGSCRMFGLYHLSTAGLYNPFNVEGAKTIAYELYAQLGTELVQWLVVPVGGGGLLGGIWRGFRDLERLGLLPHMPRMAAVQASGCAPLKRAVDENKTFLETLDEPWPDPKTVAGGIADDILFDGHTALPAVRETNGCVIAVDDDEILEAQHELAQTEGLFCEPTSAVVVAALKHLDETARGSSVCCVLTGHGVKDLASVCDRVPPPARIGLSLTELEQAVRPS